VIKFWPFRAPERGSAAGDFFGFALLYSQRAVFNCVSCERFFIVHAFDRARAKLTIRKLLGLRRPYFFLSTLAHRLNFVVGVTLGLRWSYSFASTLAHRLNFVVGPTLALLLDVDVRPSFEFRRWPNHYGCVGYPLCVRPSTWTRFTSSAPTPTITSKPIYHVSKMPAGFPSVT